ncbi:MAG: hypothetical protein LBL96_07655 [Clostridiales bacterium]|jgi:hypothetical protein|nr:hypothetical protein [Clostridiales bacterium]
MKTTSIKKILNILGVALIGLSLVFIARRFVAMKVDFSRLLTVPMISLLITMPFLTVIIIFIGSYCWKRSLALFSERKIYNGDVFEVYAKTNLMKYLPGNVGHYAGRQLFGSQLGLGQRHIALATLIEIGSQVVSEIMLCLIFSSSMLTGLLINTFGRYVFVYAAIIAAVVIGSMLALGWVFRRNKYVSELLTLARRVKFWLTLAGTVLIGSMGTAVIGIVFVVLVSQFTVLSFENACLVMAGTIASYFIGLITPGAPAGIGVREAVMVALLSSVLPEDVILLAAVAQRLIMIAGDALTYPISLLLKVGATEVSAPTDTASLVCETSDTPR